MNELQRLFVAVQNSKHWMDQANCKNMDTNLFFIEDGARLDPFVKEVCAECPVIEECMWYANETSVIDGVFAGMARNARQTWRRDNKISIGQSKKEWEASRKPSYLRTPIGEWT